MGIISYTVHHATHGLDQVAHAHARRDGLAELLLDHPAVNGLVIVPTCNRLEVLLDADPSETIDSIITTQLDIATPDKRVDTAAIQHIVQVAAGLDSLVVGEREISGQIRRALTVAHNRHTSTPVLTRILQGALTTSRRIAQLTGLASQGRSVVAAGLNLAVTQPEGIRALIVGTGAYAGATVAALRARGIHDIAVYSSSGRAQYFAQGHRITPIVGVELAQAVAGRDLVVTCRGLGSPILTVADLAPARVNAGNELMILDLALESDLETGVSDLPGVTVITMDDIRAAVPQVADAQIDQAQNIVVDAVGEIENDLRSRSAIPAVKAVREYVMDALNQELSRLPESGTIEREDAAKALRRLAAKLAHTPTIRARQAAVGGKSVEFADALEQVMGLIVDTKFTHAFTRDDWDKRRCPVTGLHVADLSAASTPTQEAV